MDNMSQSSPYYLKENCRYIFWIVLFYSMIYVELLFFLFILTGLLTHYINPTLANIFHYTSIIMINVGWIVLLLFYSRKNNVAEFRKIFFVLAFIQMLSLIHDLINNPPTMLLFSHSIIPFPYDGYISSISVISYYIIWAIALISISRNSASNSILRLSAIILIIYNFVQVIDSLANLLALPMMMAFRKYPDIAKAILSTLTFIRELLHVQGFMGLPDMVMHNVIYTTVTSFFFGALSFSKMKPPKALLPPSAEGTSLQEGGRE